MTQVTSLLEMRILLIDDSISNVQLLTAMLTKEGFTQTYATYSISDAIEILETHEIDLILLSYILPEFSGIEAARMISGDLRFEDIPIIIITANTDMQTLKSSFEHGASDYISKPINAVELSARVHSHLIRKQVNDERKHKAITDQLTDLYNRRYFDLVFDKEYEKAILEKRSLSFFMLDIDNFKKYNDNYGHQKGDETLQQVADVLKESLHRTSDYLFRIGGEEFAIILYNADQNFIHQLSDTIHHTLTARNILHDFNEAYGHVTVSVGITTLLPHQGFSKFDIYNFADKALYKAKEQGRHCSVITNH